MKSISDNHLKANMLKLHLWSGAFRGVGQLEQFALGEAGRSRNQIGGNGLDPRIVAGDAVVVGLAGEGDLVLGGRQFFLQRKEISRRLEVGVALDVDHEAAQAITRALLALRTTGTALLIATHDRRLIAAMDHGIDLGGAGRAA